MKRYLIKENDLLDLIECAIKFSAVNYVVQRENNDTVKRALDEYLEQYATVLGQDINKVTYADIARKNLCFYDLEFPDEEADS